MNGIPAVQTSEDAQGAKVIIGIGKRKVLTQARVKELFDYQDGNLIRKVSTAQRVKVGDIAGCKGDRGYLAASVDSKIYLVHRLIFLWHHGYMPEHGLDHIDQDRSNNRIENLREVSQACNIRNSKQRESLSGIKGVTWNSRYNKWRAYIMINGKNIYLGLHSDIIEAACHRLAAEQAENWEGCDKTSPAYLFVKKSLCRSID